jgi:hypothetical protein
MKKQVRKASKKLHGLFIRTRQMTEESKQKSISLIWEVLSNLNCIASNGENADSSFEKSLKAIDAFKPELKSSIPKTKTQSIKEMCEVLNVKTVMFQDELALDEVAGMEKTIQELTTDL